MITLSIAHFYLYFLFKKKENHKREKKSEKGFIKKLMCLCCDWNAFTQSNVTGKKLAIERKFFFDKIDQTLNKNLDRIFSWIAIYWPKFQRNRSKYQTQCFSRYFSSLNNCIFCVSRDSFKIYWVILSKKRNRTLNQKRHLLFLFKSSIDKKYTFFPHFYWTILDDSQITINAIF